MDTFLQQLEATFYHVTTIENWERIKNEGLKSNENKIFVSRVGELPVLLAIAFEQIPEIYYSEGIVILKLPQAKNNLGVNEIIRDNQARVEWTQPFQNIILRNKIPVENIELMMKIRFDYIGMERDSLINMLTSIANAGQVNYANHEITEKARSLVYGRN